MATKPKLDPNAIDPAVAARVQQIKDRADEENSGAAQDFLAALVKEVHPTATDNQVKLIQMGEFEDRKFSRQPKVSADNTKLVRTNKKGQVVEIDADYLRAEYGDIIPPAKKSQGAFELEIAKQAVSSVTMQGQLVELTGSAAIAEKLLGMFGGSLGKIVEPANVKARPGANGGKIDAANPFSYPPGDKEGDAAVADYIRKFGTQKALAKARELNVTLGRVPMRKAGV